MRAGRLPIIAAMGRNKKDEDEDRFGHMSYQEYLTGREYYQELMAARFSTAALGKLFGDQPLDAFTDVKQHLMLQLLAGILSPEQRTMCLAVMCGGRVETPVLMRKPSKNSAMSTRCAVVGCPEVHRNTDDYCHNHREAAASALGNVTVHGGDTLKIEFKKLGRAEIEALAPYLQDSTRLRTLVLSGTELGNTDKKGVEVLVQVLKTNTTVTALDLSNNGLKTEGAKVVAELLARCVRECWVFVFFLSSQYTACANFILVPNTTSAIMHYTGATMGNALNTNPTATHTASHSRQHPRHHTLGNIPRPPAMPIHNSTTHTTSDNGSGNTHLDNTHDNAPNITSDNTSDNTSHITPDIAADNVPDITYGISDEGALAKFVFSGDDNSKSVTMETTMIVADFSGKGLGVSGAIMLSAFLPKCM
jgi:hypothetical protein